MVLEQDGERRRGVDRFGVLHAHQFTKEEALSGDRKGTEPVVSDCQV
jgi:hypothetical protein